MPYQPPTDEKIASYYTSPHSPLNNSSNSQHLHVDEVERGLFCPSESGTPPPSYNAPSFFPSSSEDESESELCCGTNDGSLSESCGLRSGKSKTIAFILGMSFFAWIGMGGTSFYHPGARPWGTSWDTGGPSYVDPDVPVPIRPEEDVKNEDIMELRNAWMPPSMHRWGIGTWRAHIANIPKWEDIGKVEDEKPSNKPQECDKLVWREGQLRTDGCEWKMPK